MKIDLEPKKIQRVIDIWERIDPKPQYQRTPVWKIDRKRLLIDSIFRGYDLPKFYMHKLKSNMLYDFEVCDGQQRLRTIREFISSEFSLGEKVVFGTEDISDKKYSEISDAAKEFFSSYELTFAIIVEATQEEIRDLFARLQRGMGLNQAELRRALSTHIGTYVETIVDNHRFFANSGILDVRNKRQDYIDHVIAYFVNDFGKDFKGNFLRDVYEQISAEKATEYVKRIARVLDDMEKINRVVPSIFKNKWGFVDSFILIHHFLKQGRKVSINMFASQFISFENRRKQNNRNPSALIEKPSTTDEDKRLYTYITSFQKDGALKNNMRRRHEVFVGQFGYLFE